ncbi:hypothetical protein [Micromonospora craterilacus]|uniref:hypothetical protein n=1 Tax=Micromonospora craterilacus TaxID=1655439 RepID=UPI00131449B5|nr:hypothetical protein [Micromonospora craterilacus]
MSDPTPRLQWGGVPGHIDPDVPSGTAVFDLDPEDPRLIAGIRVHDTGQFDLTEEQCDQVIAHDLATATRSILAAAARRRPADVATLIGLSCLDPSALIRITGT